jgi:hypothetical protein
MLNLKAMSKAGVLEFLFAFILIFSSSCEKEDGIESGMGGGIILLLLLIIGIIILIRKAGKK